MRQPARNAARAAAEAVEAAKLAGGMSRRLAAKQAGVPIQLCLDLPIPEVMHASGLQDVVPPAVGVPENGRRTGAQRAAAAGGGVGGRAVRAAPQRGATRPVRTAQEPPERPSGPPDDPRPPEWAS